MFFVLRSVINRPVRLSKIEGGGQVFSDYHVEKRTLQAVKTDVGAIAQQAPSVESTKQVRDQLTMDIKQLGDPRLQDALKQLSDPHAQISGEQLQAIAKQVAGVVEDRLGVLQQHISSLTDVNAATKEVKAADAHLHTAEKTQAAAGRRVSAADELLSDAKKQIASNVEAMHGGNWKAATSQAERLLHAVPGKTPEEAAVKQAIKDKDPKALYEAMTRLMDTCVKNPDISEKTLTKIATEYGKLWDMPIGGHSISQLNDDIGKLAPLQRESDDAAKAYHQANIDLKVAEKEATKSDKDLEVAKHHGADKVSEKFADADADVSKLSKKMQGGKWDDIQKAADKVLIFASPEQSAELIKQFESKHPDPAVVLRILDEISWKTAGNKTAETAIKAMLDTKVDIPWAIDRSLGDLKQEMQNRDALR